MADVSLSTIGLTPLAWHFLAQRGIATLEALCQTSPRQLLFQPVWLTPAERREREHFAGLALRDIQCCLAKQGRSLRGDRYTDWVNEPLEKLQLTPRAVSLLRYFRLTSVGELLALSTDDLFFTSFRPTAVSELFRSLAAHGLHLRDGRPRGPDDVGG